MNDTLNILSSSLALKIDSTPPEVIIYILILVAGNVVGLLGNILVIAATSTKRGNTFKLDHGTVIVLRHLAIADVLFIIIYPVPILITYIMQTWPFGKELCYGIGLLVSVPVTANINFLLAMTVHRYVRCKFPVKVHSLTPKRAKIACGVIWVYSCTFIAYTVVTGLKIVFNPKLACCSFVFPQSPGNAVLIFGTTVVPFVVIVSLNFFLWLHVRAFTTRLSSRTMKHKVSIGNGGDAQNKQMSDMEKKQAKKFRLAYRQSVLTTTLITALFAITWMPTVLRFAYSAFAGESDLPAWVEKVRYFYFFGAWGNPVIYSMINQGFRNYFKKFINRICKVYVLDPTQNITVLGLSIREIVVKEKEVAPHTLTKRTSTQKTLVVKNNGFPMEPTPGSSLDGKSTSPPSSDGMERDVKTVEEGSTPRKIVESNGGGVVDPADVFENPEHLENGVI